MNRTALDKHSRGARRLGEELYLGPLLSFDRFARVTNSPKGSDFPLAHVNSSTRNLLKLDQHTARSKSAPTPR